MSGQPIMSVSGIRGIVGESFTSELCSLMAFYQTRLAGGGKIIIGRDTRPSGPQLIQAIAKGIVAAHGTPVDIGIAPTPTICVAVDHLKARAGIMVTASHNPFPYNGYKMVHHSGRLYNGAECEKVYNEYRNNDVTYGDKISPIGEITCEEFDAVSVHIERILAAVDIDMIKSAGLSVAVDSINGAAAAVFPKLFGQLGVAWKGVHTKLNGDFIHNPEPRPEHLIDLSQLLRNTTGMNVGFGFDPDADRLITMGENGEPISEELTLALALTNILEKGKSDITTNLSTSRIIDDVAEQFGVKVFRTKIGEANVVEGMFANNCTVGGEGNGGVIYPKISTVRDGLAACALIVELLARKRCALMSLVNNWSKYILVKEKISCKGKDPYEIIVNLTEKFADETVDTLDGLKIIREKSWVHVRPSNTEPVIRCYAEALTDDEAKDLVKMIMNAL